MNTFDSLKDEWFPPEENVLHDFTAGLGIEDSVEVNLTEVLLLLLQVPCLHHPHRQLSVQPSEVITVRSSAVIEANGEK